MTAVKPEARNLLSQLRCGAFAGMVTWLWYAIFESFVAALAPVVGGGDGRPTV